jgi:GNAT superfamily N-acetyltransferase
LSGVRFPEGWRIENLAKSHNRRRFYSGQADVDRWLKQSALQSQRKHLTVTKILINERNFIVAYYTLSTSQIDFTDLPAELSKSLPRRQLPVAVLAWFGVDRSFHSQGIGKRLFATALRDCHEASGTFAFIAVVLDCIDQSAKGFYQQFDFEELPGFPMRLFLSFKLLDKMMKS